MQTVTTYVEFGREVIPADKLPEVAGMTLEELESARSTVEEQRTWCTIGDTAFTLAEFEEIHKDVIVLTDN